MQEEQKTEQHYELPPNFVDDTKIPIETKEKIIKRKKFLFTFIAIFLGAFIILGGASLTLIIKNVMEQRRAPVVIKDEEPGNTQTPNTDPNKPGIPSATINEYSSDNLRINLEHSSLAKVVDIPETESQPKKLEILFMKDSTDKDSWTEENISSGYIFRVTNFKVENRNLDEITAIKKESYKLECPETSTFDSVNKDVVNFEEARTFKISNCNGDYVITYVQKFNTIFEIVQISRGDYGYRQLYTTTTGEIFRSLKFHPESTGPVGPTVTYVNTEIGISFAHPLLNETCCNVPAPVKTFEKVISLGDPSTYENETKFDGIGFFMARGRGTFQEIVEEQKKTLTDDYIVAKGSAPITEETKYSIKGKEAVRLRGYSWKGNDIIYINVTRKSKSPYTLAISILNASGESFDRTVNDIIESLEFL